MPTLHRLMFLLLLALTLTPAAWCAAPSPPQELLLQFEKDFILRVADDLSRTLAAAEEMNAALQQESEDRTLLAYDGQGSSSLDVLNICREQTDWLAGQIASYEQGLDAYFARRRPAPDWAGRHDALQRGFQARGEEIGHTLRKIEQQKGSIAARIDKIVTTIRERRLPVLPDDLELARKLWPDYSPRELTRQEARYVELSETEVLRLQTVLLSLAEEVRYHEGREEVARHEREWLRIKAAQFGKSLAVANALRNDPAALAETVRDLLDTCEQSREALARASGRIERTLASPPSPASGQELDHRRYRQQQLELLKLRFDRHGAWLAGEIDSLRVDLNALER